MTDAPAPLLSPLLAALPGVRHAFFTREGGASAGLYASLNAGAGSRDDPAAVTENRRRCAAWFGRPAEALLTAYQVHSADALTVEAPWPAGERPRGDAVATRTAGLVCGALSADCAPVLIVDAEARVAAAAHAGWRGAVGGIVASTVAALQALGGRPGRMVAAVGPCIGQASYEVGEDFRTAVLAQAPEAQRFFTPEHAPGKRRFDLPGFVRLRLEQAGVGQAETLDRDTCAEEADFFSNRRAVLRREGDYGRLLSAVMLES
ncbi:MAG: peptidoglycan editing factor PgeF [Caulobacteraceae bacterium]|nr:peptidoglycan editing factor PgeF [Caulobacter sp.]